MRRLFLQEPLGEEMRVTGADAHHLMHVLRAKAGQLLTVVDPAGRAAEAEITGFSAQAVTLRWVRNICDSAESSLELCLAQCLPKGDKMSFIVQKATELGATAILPLQSQNCVVRYDRQKCMARERKWRRTAEEAAKQCGRSRIPEVAPAMALGEWLCALREKPRLKGMEIFLCDEHERSRTLKDFLQSTDSRRFTAVVGPEGGIAPEEAALAAECGITPVSLGPRILRAETAALAVLSIVQYEKGDL